MVVLIYHDDWHCIASWMDNTAIDGNSLWQIVYSSFVYQARSATGYFDLANSAWDG